MKKPVLFIAVAVSASLLSSCKFLSVSDSGNIKFNPHTTVIASDNVDTRKIEVPEFSAIEVGQSCKVFYVPGDCGLEIKTHANLFEHLETTVDDGTLKIRTDFSNIRDMDTMDIYIQSPSLDGVSASGAVEFHANEGIRSAGDFNLFVSGAGDIHISGLEAADVKASMSGAAKLDLEDVECNNLKFSISGAGECTVSGEAGSADMSISGAGKIDLRGLSYGNLKSSVSGAGRILTPEK